jgi:Rod binding domain-containing protein
MAAALPAFAAPTAPTVGLPDLKAKARASAVEFEAVFLNSMFAQMFTGIDGDGPFGGGGSAGVWRSFLTDEYSRSFAKAGGIGIADHVYPAATAARLSEVMDALAGVVQQETELVRSGRLGAATKLEVQKAELARRYVADTLKLRGRHAQLPPDLSATLRQRHESFRGLLQLNLTVLATAQAVSEGIVRGVSGELARKSAPQTYGAGGRTVAPGKSASPPLAVSRSL